MTPTADLMKLVEKWRGIEKKFSGPRSHNDPDCVEADTYGQCADELEYAIAEIFGPPDVAALTASCDARVGGDDVKDRAFACLVDAAEDMLAEIDTCGHPVDPAYRAALHEALSIAKSVGHVPHWALPAIENALDLLDEHGYTHSDLIAVRDWLKNKPRPGNGEDGNEPNDWSQK